MGGPGLALFTVFLNVFTHVCFPLSSMSLWRALSIDSPGSLAELMILQVVRETLMVVALLASIPM